MNSDFKNNRVEDPTAISDKQQKKVRNYCKEYFEKAVVKHREHEKKAGKGTKEVGDTANGESDEGVDVKMSDDEGGKDTGEETETPGSSLKRKRDDDPEKEDGKRNPSPSKRQRSSTPPPPPPPPMSPGQAESTPTDKEAVQAAPTPPPPPPIPAEQS